MHDFELDEPEGLPHETLSERMSVLVNRLEADAMGRVGKRLLVEERWLIDLRQYEGQEDDGVLSNLRAEDRSTAVINVTRSKCDTFESKLFDMLFPTDDRNWSISPTPVPEMDQEEEGLGGQIEQLTALANVEGDDQQAEAHAAQADQLAQRMAELENERSEASKRCQLMEEEIADNLVETDYAAQCRSVIHDATVFGNGILKGPLPLSDRVRKNWIREEGGAGAKYSMRFQPEQADRFGFNHVSFWNLFPDTTARNFGQVESWMERHLMRARDLRHFAKQPGVDQDAVRRVLREGPQEMVPQYLIDIDTVAEEENSGLSDKFYVVWEYRGPLEEEEMQELLTRMASEMQSETEGDADNDTGDTGFNPDDLDPLMVLDAVVYVCQGEILKMGVNHMDDNAQVYSVFQIHKSPARLWSVGLPYVMRDQSDILNDAWRAMIDNAEFAAFPISEIDTRILQRADGSDPEIAARAVFERVITGGEPGLIFHHMPINQEAYQNIIGMVMQFFDQETNVSVLASGEQSTGTQQTAGGMALLMNSVNVVFRRVVKNYDDEITHNVITRSYDFLMQFSEKEAIKGDYAVHPRGSSVLLVREVQSQNLLLLATQISLHPVLGKHFKMRELAKKIVQSMMLSAEDLLVTQQELAQLEQQEAEAEANAPPDPAMVKLQTDMEIEQLRRETQLMLAQIKAETDLQKAGLSAQSALQTMAGRLEAIRAQSASKERIFAAEAGIEGRMPDDRGSGGYLA